MTAKRSSDPGALVPARRAAPPAVRDPAVMRAWAEELVARARDEGVELTGEGGLLTDLVRQVLQTGLEVELGEHLGYEPYDPAGRDSGNSRNGYSTKTVPTEIGDVELPRSPPNEQAALKVPYLAATQRRPSGDNLTGKINGWKAS